MDELGPGARDVLRVAREARAPTDEDRERLERRLAIAIAAGAAGAAVGAASTASAASAGTGAGSTVGAGAAGAGGAAAAGGASVAAGGSATALWIKGVSALLCTTAIGAGAWIAIAPPPQPVEQVQVALGPHVATEDAEPVVELAPPVGEDEPSVASEEPAAREDDPPAERRSRPRRGAASAPDLAAELELLHQAQRAWRAGDGARTLSLLEDHESRFARSQLAPERTALRILALCDLGRVAEARRIGVRFLRTASQSPSRRSVEESCAVE